MSNERIAIVFRVSPEGGSRFDVFLEGLDRKALEGVPMEEWPRAALYAVHSFAAVIDLMKKIGSFEGISPKRPG